MPHPTLAATIAPFSPTPVHDMPTRELADEIGGVCFEIWVPQGAQPVRMSANEILVGCEGLQMMISLAHDRPPELEATMWRTRGALVLRSVPLADGYLVTALGDRCLDVMRLVRHRTGIVRVHVHLEIASRSGWQPQSAAEALCASLQIR